MTAEALQFDPSRMRLRANPAYEIVVFDRLSTREQRLFQTLAREPDAFGVLRPKHDANLTLKSISRDTALLLFCLQQPGLAPRYAIDAMGSEAGGFLLKLVLDGVLEVEVQEEWRRGPAALAVFGQQAPAESEGRLAALSRRALEYGHALHFTDPLALSRRLYSYNCIPLSGHWRAALPTAKETATSLALAEGGAAAGAFARDWNSLPESEWWISFARHGLRGEGETSSTRTYKLYVSPASHEVYRAVSVVAEEVARSKAFFWKVGRGAAGLLRPDKIVAYFRRFSDLQETTFAIGRRLQGCPAHGVPFTAELAGDGLLSWGTDPAPVANPAVWFEEASWRARICNRLALALVDARESDDAVSFALQRLRLEGIDVGDWTPTFAAEWQ